MIKLCGGGEPGYLLNRACEMLRRGKLGGYHYKRIQGSDEGIHKDKPNKNLFSHSSDAEQYLCLGFQGGYVQDIHEDNFHYDDAPRRVSSGSMGY